MMGLSHISHRSGSDWSRGSSHLHREVVLVVWLLTHPTPLLQPNSLGTRSRRWRPSSLESWSILLNKTKLLLLQSMLLLMQWSPIRCPLLRHQSLRCSESGSPLEAKISWRMSGWYVMLLHTRGHLSYSYHWSPTLILTDKILLYYEGLLDNIMQSLRHQNPNLGTYAIVKAKHDPVDLTFLSIKM